MATYIRLFLAAILCISATVPASARPFSINDLLHNERFIEPHFDPTGRWLVFERLLPLTTMARFDTLSASRILRARLYRVDVNHPAEAQPLLDRPRPGSVIYGFSPDGEKLAIGRLDGQRWQLGIVSMASRAVRWIDVTPDYSPFGQTLAWLSNDQLVVIVNQAGRLPEVLGYDQRPPSQLPRRWKATEKGDIASVTVLGSGRFLEENPHPPTKSLVLINIAHGRQAIIASGPFLTLTPSPDHHHVALLEQGEATTLAQHPLSQIDWPYRRRLAIVDIANREQWQPCPDCDLADVLKWSPAGNRLAFVARRDDEDWPSVRLMTANAVNKQLMAPSLSGLLLTVADAVSGTARPAIAWQENNLLAYAHRHREARSDWYRVRGDRARAMTASLNATSSRLIATRTCSVAMPANGALWCLGGGVARRIDQPGLSQTLVGGHLVEWRRGPTKLQVFGDPWEGQALAIAKQDTARILAASSLTSALVVGVSKLDGEKQLILLDQADATRIASANTHLKAVRAARAQPIRTSVDGSTITSWLYLPPQSSGTDRVPLVVIPYPGQSFGNRPPPDQGPGSDRLFANVQLITAAGFGVLLPGMPEPRSPVRGVLRFADQLDPIVDAAVATGVIDPARIALWGASYGGYAVTMIASETCRYRSIVAEHGIYDLGTLPAIFGPVARLSPETALPVATKFAWAETGQGRMGVSPWADPSRYVMNSPYYRARQIDTPLMLIAADRDSAPLSQAEAMFSALFRQNKDAELVTYWGEDHVIGSPANLRDLYRRVFKWLRETLSGLSAPTSSCGASQPDSRTSASASIRGPARLAVRRNSRVASGNHEKGSLQGAAHRAGLREQERRRETTRAGTTHFVRAFGRRIG